MFHDSRLSYPSRSWRSVEYNWRLYVKDISKHEDLERPVHWSWSSWTNRCNVGIKKSLSNFI